MIVKYISMEVLFMIFNLKDNDINNYITWVYNTLLKMIQGAETDISINGGEIERLNSFVGYDGQLMYSLNLANEQIPEGTDLNEYIMAGTYYCSGTGIASSIANSPTNLNYKLIVEFITSGFINQTVISRAGNVWYRTYTISNETWGAWTCGSLDNISKISMNNNGQLVVTRADGVTATFNPDSLL